MSDRRLVHALLTGRPYFGLSLAALQGPPQRHKFLPELLKKAAAQHPSGHLNILEVGSWAGASAVTWGKTLQDLGRSGRIFCNDIWQPYLDLDVNRGSIYAEMDESVRSGTIKQLFDHNIRAAGVADLIEVKMGTSEEVLPKLCVKSFDLVYIDGNHEYQTVKSDLINAKRLIREGGIICGDDLEVLYEDIFPDTLMRLSEAAIDFVECNEIGRWLHPGVTRAVGEELGPVSCWDGVWAIEWREGKPWPCEIDIEHLALPKHIAAELANVDFVPELIEERIEGHNIVRFGDHFFALPIALGPVDIRQISEAELASILHDTDLARLRERLRFEQRSSLQPREVEEQFRVSSDAHSGFGMATQGHTRASATYNGVEALTPAFGDRLRDVPEPRQEHEDSAKAELADREQRIAEPDQSQAGSLAAELAAAERALAEMRMSIAENGVQISGIRSDVGTHTDRLSTLEQEAARSAAIETQLAERDRMLRGLEANLTTVNQSFAALRGSIAENGAQIDGIRSDLGSHTYRLTVLEREAVRATAIAAELAERDRRIAALDQQQMERDQMFGGVEADLAATHRALAELSGSVSEKGDDIGNIRSDLGSQGARLTTLEQEAARSAAIATELADRDRRMALLSTEASRHDARLAALEAAGAKTELALAAELKVRDERISAFNALVNKLNEQLLKIDFSLNEVRRGGDETREAEAARATRSLALERDLRLIAERIAQLDGAAVREGAVVSMLTDRDQKIAELQRALAELAAAGGRIGSLEADLLARETRLEARIENLDTQYWQKLTGALASRDGRLQSLEDRLTEGRKAATELEQALASRLVRGAAVERDIAIQSERLTNIEHQLVQRNQQPSSFPPALDVLHSLNRKDFVSDTGNSVVVAGAAPPGHFMFGPYIAVEPGVFVFELSCRATAIRAPSKRVMTVEIAIGTLVVGERILFAGDLANPVRIAFEVSEAARKQSVELEFRISHHNNADIEVTTARLHAVSGGLPVAAGAILGRRRRWWSRWLGRP